MKPIEGIQDLCNRGRELKKQYDKYPGGIFGAAIIQLSINEGEASIALGDCARMVKACKSLETISDIQEE